MLARFDSLHPRTAIALLTLAALAALCIAWTLEYGFGLPPCELCLWQRKPYMAAICLGLGFWLCSTRAPRLNRIALGVLLVCFLAAAGTAGYHSGVEYGIFKGLSGCSGTVGGASTIEDLRQAILEAPVVSCNQPLAAFLGISLATWNMLYALCISGLAVILFRHTAR